MSFITSVIVTRDFIRGVVASKLYLEYFLGRHSDATGLSCQPSAAVVAAFGSSETAATDGTSLHPDVVKGTSLKLKSNNRGG